MKMHGHQKYEAGKVSGGGGKMVAQDMVMFALFFCSVRHGAYRLVGAV